MFPGLRRVLSLSLAVLTFTASTTFSMGIHFCGGQLESISVIKAAEPCGMEKNIPPCHRQMATSCCEDQTIIHDGDEFNNVQSINSDFETEYQTFQPDLILLYSLVHNESTELTFQTYDLHPPHISIERHIAYRSILI